MSVRPTPVTDGQLSQLAFPHDPEGAFSCVAYSFAYAAADATNGVSIHSGQVVRNWTGDHLGGLELGQCDIAMHTNAHLEFDTQVDRWAEFLARLAKGYGAVILGGYGPIADSPFSGQDSFRGNHGIYVPPSFKVMDPLADGRARPLPQGRAYKYGNFPYPQTLVHEFAANLRLGSGARAGYDHVEASYIRMATAVPVPVTKYKAVVLKGPITYYNVDARGIATVQATGKTGGFSGTCTAPRLVNYRLHHQSHYMRMVQMTSGGYKDLWINVNRPGTTVRVIP